MQVGKPLDKQVSGLELSILKFTPSTSGQYIFNTGNYNGKAQSSRKDIILELYSDEALTDRIAASNYEQGKFPHISKYLEAGTTYYLTFAGYLGKTARARISVKPGLKTISSITSLEYNSGQGPMLGYANTLTFTINRSVSTNESYYIVPYLGWDNENFYEKPESGKTITLSGTRNEITIDDIALTSSGGDVLYTKFKIYDNNTSNRVLLWEGPINAVARSRSNQAIANLQFNKRTNGSLIYSNSPEYITKFDLTDGEKNGNIKSKIFEQEELTGRNTYYASHNSWWGGADNYYPTKDFYWDIDFYNPSTTQTVIVTISNLIAGTNEEDSTAFEKRWGEYLSGGQSASFEIGPGEHVLLFEDKFGGAILCHNSFNGEQQYRKWTRTFGAFFDFNVSDGDVTVSELAAYKTKNLRLRDDTKNIVDATNVELDAGEVMLKADRENEGDIETKLKGYAKNEDAWIDADLSFVVTDNTHGAVTLNFKDDYYNATGGTNVQQQCWITNTGPIQDASAKPFMLPGSLHNLKYHSSVFGTNRFWNFNFEHKNTEFRNEHGGSNESINIRSDSAVAALKSEAPQGWFTANSTDTEALIMGEYGTVYHYTITVTNAGNSSKDVTFQIANTDGIVIGSRFNQNNNYTLYNTLPLNDELVAQNLGSSKTVGLDKDQWFPDGNIWSGSFTPNMLTLTVPKGETKTFEVVTTIIPGANGGLQNRLWVD